jgi:thiosulfate/3-mercaptopyruvate sulfurtransferase
MAQVGRPRTEPSVPAVACQPSIQRTPTLYQAGTSGAGKAFAARHAEGVFLSTYDARMARGLVDDVRGLAAAAGHDSRSLKFCSIATVIVAPTDAEAQAKLKDYASYASWEGSLARWSALMLIDLSRLDPDRADRMTMPTLPALLGPALLAERLDDPDVLILDATVLLDRPAEGGPYTPVPQSDSYNNAHIPGAGFAHLVHDLADPDAPFPFGIPTPERFAARAGALGVGDGVRVVAYAQDSPMWATRLWWLLTYFGFDAVSVLDGGLPAWRAAGLPTTDEPTPPRAGRTFDSRPRPALLARRADVEALLAEGESAACLVNALSPQVFRGEGPTSYSRPGRIPTSVNVPWTGLIDPDTNKFRGPEELAVALVAAGASAGRPVVAYCGGGISATIDVFALSLLGRDDVRLYDGSLTEWTADPELPVEVG